MNIKFLVSGLVLAVLLGVGMIQGEKFLGSFQVVANAVAKTGCTCVFVAGRSVDECAREIPPGFDVATAYLDRERQVMHSSIYGVIRGTARYRERTGCTLE
jgi:hypothetical protein